MSSGTQEGLCSLSPMGFNLTLLTSLVTKSHYCKWLTWNVLVSVNYKQTVVCITKPPSQMVLFLGSPKHSQGQYNWTETSAKAQGEQTFSFVLIHFQQNENNTSYKIAAKGISGLHKLEQSLGLLWLSHGTVSPHLQKTPRWHKAFAPISAETEQRPAAHAEPSTSVFTQRANGTRSALFCTQYHTVDKQGCCLPALFEPQRTIRLAVTTQRYSALLGYRWGEVQSQSHGPGGERTVGPFRFKLQAADFQSGKGLQELIRKFKTADFSQNWHTKVDI